MIRHPAEWPAWAQIILIVIVTSVGAAVALS